MSFILSNFNHVLEVLDALFEYMTNVRLLIARGVIQMLGICLLIGNQALVVVWHVESLGLTQVNILWVLTVALGVAACYCPLAGVHLVLRVLSLVRLRFITLIWNYLVVAKEAGVLLDFALSLARARSWCSSLIEVNLYPLASISGCRRPRLIQRVLAFEATLVELRLLLVLLCWIASWPLARVVLLFNLLLQNNLLFFQNLHLIRVFDRSGPLLDRRRIWNDSKHRSLIFFLVLRIKAELLVLV